MPLKVFLIAIAVRWTYAIAIFAAMGGDGFKGVDSIGYLAYAQQFAGTPIFESLHSFAWLGTSPYIMPLFRWLIGMHALLFGAQAPLAYVLTQGVIDACTCLLIYRIAQQLDPHYAKPAMIAAAFNPTQIVLSGLIYTDTPFLFFVAVFLYAALWWLREPGIRPALLIGFGLGAATLIRAVAAPWAPILLVFLLIAAIIKQQFSKQKALQLATAAAVFSTLISPVIWRNVSQYGSWSLTAQGGIHLALWVVPLVAEAKTGVPWQQGYDTMTNRINTKYPEPSNNPFVQSNRLTEIAREALSALGIGPMAKAWITGAAINVAAPAIILSPPVSHLPRMGFYATPGSTPVQKIWNFLFNSDNALYAWLLIVGIIGVAAVRSIQIAGAIVLIKRRDYWPALSLFGLWIIYILAINGPIASPKYRLPLEPPLVVLAGAGYVLLRRQFQVPGNSL